MHTHVEQPLRTSIHTEAARFAVAHGTAPRAIWPASASLPRSQHSRISLGSHARECAIGKRIGNLNDYSFHYLRLYRRPGTKRPEELSRHVCDAARAVEL